MRAIARVIVEEQDGQWTAYFGDEPHNAAAGAKPTQALQALLRTLGGGQFQESEILPLIEATRDGHLEYLVPFQTRSIENRAQPTPNLGRRHILFSHS